jgi:hypothetical protein
MNTIALRVALTLLVATGAFVARAQSQVSVPPMARAQPTAPAPPGSATATPPAGVPPRASDASPPLGATGTAAPGVPPPVGATGTPPAGSPAAAPAAPAHAPPAPAYAPPAYAPAQSPAVVYVRPAPPPPPKVGVHLHDGFYLRMSFGMGPGKGTFTQKSEGYEPDEYKFAGLGAAFDVMVGGSPLPGFVIGGAVVGHTIIDPSVKLNGTALTTGNSQYAYNMSTFGAFVAIYPDPKLGFNFHGLAGVGTISVKAGDATVTPEPVGLALMGGAGYDFWIADQWSMGPDFRLAYCKAFASNSPVTNDASILMPTISFTATLH